MPLALNLPPAPTGQVAYHRATNFGEPIQITQRTSGLGTPSFFNVASGEVSEDIVRSALDRLLREAEQKVEAARPIFERRLQLAEQNGYLPAYHEGLDDTMNTVLALMAPNPCYSAISFDVHQDGAFELVFVSADKQNRAYFTIDVEEDGGVSLLYNEFTGRENSANFFGHPKQVFQQIRATLPGA